MDFYQPSKKYPVKHDYPKKLKSKRFFEYLSEQSSKLRRKVSLFIILAVIVYLVYFFYFSDNFRINNINLQGNINLASEEIEEMIKNSLAKRNFFIFPENNYFLLNKKLIRKDFQERYPLADLTISKKIPHTINIDITERVGQLIWVTNERYYLMNLQGVLVKEFAAKELVNANMPVIYDNSNTPAYLNEQVISLSFIHLISEIFDDFSTFNIPEVEIDHFRMDGPEVNYLKVVTKQGFEIHLNTELTLAEQFYKLKRSLEESKIDLTKVQYINLRVENQVIYK
ncbi:FtsQ-type POTRA domain-containing protein [Patescibacteria group bacterium]|nr:FtsQ-type POTRA domain-containing protein [Patescibacteria group bacterium]